MASKFILVAIFIAALSMTSIEGGRHLLQTTTAPQTGLPSIPNMPSIPNFPMAFPPIPNMPTTIASIPRLAFPPMPNMPFINFPNSIPSLTPPPSN
uniref:Uncharacterized protein n=1 Tax=Chenopodium quinoa TaxID=63459 RepID=A0A803LFZ8_CHEQI